MKNQATIYKQKLFRSHEFLGIFISLPLFICIFFGIFAIYLPYIQVWENPSLYFEKMGAYSIKYEKMLKPILADKSTSNSKIIISLPNNRNLPSIQIQKPFTKPISFNPNKYEKIKIQNTHLANFLNEMHYAKPLGMIALILLGILSVVGLFLIINGLVMVAKYRFGNIQKNKKRFYSNWHRKIFIWLFTPFFLIILCSAVMGVSFSMFAPISLLSTNAKQIDVRKIIGHVLFPKENLIKYENTNAKMLPIATLLKKAAIINPDINYEKITLINWNDASARIIFEGYNPYKPFLNGITNKPKVILNAQTADLIQQINAEDKRLGILAFEAVYFLHLLFGVDIISRSIVAFMMLLCGIGIVFSILLYQEKRTKYLKEVCYYHWFNKLCIAVIIGVIPATASLFATQWLLAFEQEYRLTYQQGIFFNIWLGTLAYSFYELNSIKTIKKLLNIGGVLFILSVILRWYKYGINIKIPSLIGVDMALLSLGVLCLFLSYKLTKKVLNV